MDNKMILQMMQSFLPPESREVLNVFQEVTELQNLILSHAASGREDWQLEMLEQIRPRLPEQNRYMIDIIIKYMELAALMRAAEQGKGEHTWT